MKKIEIKGIAGTKMVAEAMFSDILTAHEMYLDMRSKRDIRRFLMKTAKATLSIANSHARHKYGKRRR